MNKNQEIYLSLDRKVSFHRTPSLSKMQSSHKINKSQSNIDINRLSSNLVRIKKMLQSNLESSKQISDRNQRINSQIEMLQNVISDFAKRLLIFHHKHQDYLQLLLQHQRSEVIQAIQRKYQKMKPIDPHLLLEIINGPANGSTKYESEIKKKDNSEKYKYQTNQQRVDLLDDESITDFQIKNNQNQDKIMRNTNEKNGFAGKDTEKSRFINLQPELSPPKRKRGRPPKYPLQKIKNSTAIQKKTPKSLSYSQLQDEFEEYIPQTRIPIHLQNSQLYQKQQQLKEMAEKQKSTTKNLMRSEFGMIAQFVHKYLVTKIRYNDDHAHYGIPKKQILKIYMSWNTLNKRTIAFNTPKLIQMAITNELKIAFPGIDVFSKFYKGLYFPEAFELAPDFEIEIK